MGRMTLKIWSPAAHAIGMMLAGWTHREEEAAGAYPYQKEETRALREMLGGKRLRFTDAQRRRLALKARALSHANLRELGSLVHPRHADPVVPQVRGRQVR
jgi:putative transposase